MQLKSCCSGINSYPYPSLLISLSCPSQGNLHDSRDPGTLSEPRNTLKIPPTCQNNKFGLERTNDVPECNEVTTEMSINDAGMDIDDTEMDINDRQTGRLID